MRFNDSQVNEYKDEKEKVKRRVNGVCDKRLSHI